MKNNIAVIFYSIFSSNGLREQKVIENRIKLIKEQFKLTGITKIQSINLNGPEVIIKAQFYLLEKRLSKCDSAFFISQENYHVSKEIIEELYELRKKKKYSLVYTPHTSYEATLLYNLRIYSRIYLFDKSLARKFIHEFDKSKFLEENISFFSNGKYISKKLLNINSKNILPLYRQSCKTDLPIQICIETNSGCNFRCYMCPYHGGRQNKKSTFIHSPDEMPYEKIISLIDEVYALERPYDLNQPVEIIPFRRGEFLLYPKWREVVSYIKEKGFRCYISTNGSTWSAEDIDFVVDKEVDCIQVSLNGHDEDSHKKLRLNGSFNLVYNTAKSLVNNKIKKGKLLPHVRLCNTINERNFDKIDKYIDKWVNKFDGLLLGIENYAHENSGSKKKFKMEFAAQPQEDSAKRPPCGMLKDNIWINADGKVVLCLGSKLIEIGSVYENSLKTIINSSLRKQVMRDQSSGDFNNEICDECQQWFNVYNEKKSYKNYDNYVSCSEQNLFTKKSLKIID